MQLKQRVSIPAELEDVWQALNDPKILKQCLPGCDRFERMGNDAFEVAMTVKVGPVKAKFTGAMTLADMNPPFSYTITGSGKGGVAGFAKGGADVLLEPVYNGAATMMTYGVSASVGGKLAQIGSRLVTGAARKLANDFFTKFVRLLSGDENMAVEMEMLE